MADNRLWYKNDVGYLDNPKVADLVETNPHAVLLHQACIAYSKQHGTDGLVLLRVAMRQACAKQCDLDAALATGLLEAVDDRHVLVHDYLEHQTSAEQDRQRADKAKRAADARWGKQNGATGNARSIAASNAGSNARSNAASTCKRREEKRREEHSLPASGAEVEPARADITDLCAHLADRIAENGSRRPTISKTWTEAARLLLDRDGRDPDEAHSLIDWCQNDDFWQANILSMPTFRKQYDKLRLRAGQPPRQAPGASRVQQQQDSLMRQLEIAQQLDAQEGNA